MWCYTSHANGCAIVGWVQPTGLTTFAVGCTHPTNGSPVPACGISPELPPGLFSSRPVEANPKRKRGNGLTPSLSKASPNMYVHYWFST